MSRLLSRCLALIAVTLLAVSGVRAQDVNVPVRDPLALAERYFGLDEGTPEVPPLTPIYRVGDTAQFWVGKTSQATPIRIQATLAASAPNVYLWIDDAVTAQGSLGQTAQQVSQIVTIYRRQDNYRPQTVLPEVGAVNDPRDLLPIPDVDNDPHLYVLYTTDLSEDRSAVVNPLDSLPVTYAPYSNEHEMLYVNTSSLADTALSDPIYVSLLARGIYRWIMEYNVPGQADWLTEALDWLLLFNLQQAQVGDENLSAYLQAPDTPLFQPATLTTQAQALGGQQLFLIYFLQRYGSTTFSNLFMQASSGIAPLDAALAANQVVDPVTGAPVTGRDAFADFAVTNGLNVAFGDGRYVQRTIQLPQGQTAAGTTLDAQSDLKGLSVSQFGAQYFRYTAAEAGTVKVNFSGNETVARLPMPIDRDPADRFYWSGRDDNRNPGLTRAVDLSGVAAATLTFDAWYDLAPGWNYGYVSVSSDDGTTWTALPAPTSSINNSNGAAYGAGFNGISNPDKPRPFPIMGVVIGGDGITASDVSLGGPAATAGVRPGDVIIGYDEQEWNGTPNILGLLANYAPGDTLHLYIQRESDKLDIPVVLGAHPTRVIDPAPRWLAQSVDLTPYAGKQILLRFEAVTLPGHEDGGFAVDNIAIPEIDFSDNAEGGWNDWQVSGWQQVDNQLTQRWLVQAATSGSQTKFPRVQQWIGADDDASSGEWRIVLDAGETLTLVVSGANDDTSERATFDLALK